MPDRCRSFISHTYLIRGRGCQLKPNWRFFVERGRNSFDGRDHGADDLFGVFFGEEGEETGIVVKAGEIGVAAGPIELRETVLFHPRQ